MTTSTEPHPAGSTLIPGNLPSIGKATLTLLRSKGVETARDIYDRGAEGHTNIPGLGPAKWAVLEDWMWDALTFEDRVDIVVKAMAPGSTDSSGWRSAKAAHWDPYRHEPYISEQGRTYNPFRIVHQRLSHEQVVALQTKLDQLVSVVKSDNEHYVANLALMDARHKEEGQRYLIGTWSFIIAAWAGIIAIGLAMLYFIFG
jgi:hypothetical protein